MKKQTEKERFIQSQLCWCAFLIASGILLAIISPLIWIWGDSDLALKFLLSGIFVYLFASVITIFAKRVISNAYDAYKSEQAEIFEKTKLEKPEKSSFLQRLEDAQRAQQEQARNRKR